MRPRLPGRVRLLRLLTRLRNTATRITGAACYGSLVALTGFYGLLSWAVVTTITTAAAVACLLVGRE